MSDDALIERLRERAADPRRRTEYVPSMLEAGLRSMSIGGVLSFGQSVADIPEPDPPGDR